VSIILLTTEIYPSSLSWYCEERIQNVIRVMAAVFFWIQLKEDFNYRTHTYYTFYNIHHTTFKYIRCSYTQQYTLYSVASSNYTGVVRYPYTCTNNVDEALFWFKRGGAWLFCRQRPVHSLVEHTKEILYNRLSFYNVSK